MKRSVDHDEEAREMEVSAGDEEAVLQDAYFTGYLKPSAHELMLRDQPRTIAYRNALQANANAIRGKVVVDVGCGSGILSLFAAQAGAAKVYAIEASAMARAARQIVADNGYEGVVEVIESTVEKVTIGRVADVIVSEWMGFYLLNESMLDSVLWARDNLLKPNGLLIPSAARIWACPVEAPTPEVDFWAQPVYGFDMSSMMHVAIAERAGTPLLEVLNRACCFCAPQVAFSFDLRRITVNELNVLEASLEFVTEREGQLKGLALWFDCPDMDLGTGPDRPPTHWRQTTLMLPEWPEVAAKQTVVFQVLLSKSDTSARSYDATVSVSGFDGHEVDCMCPKCEVVRHYSGE